MLPLTASVPLTCDRWWWQQQRDKALQPRERRALAAERRLGIVGGGGATSALVRAAVQSRLPTEVRSSVRPSRRPVDLWRWGPGCSATTASMRVGAAVNLFEFVCLIVFFTLLSTRRTPLPLVPFQWRDYHYCSKDCFEKSFRKITDKEQ